MISFFKQIATYCINGELNMDPWQDLCLDNLLHTSSNSKMFIYVGDCRGIGSSNNVKSEAKNKPSKSGHKREI